MKSALERLNELRAKGQESRTDGGEADPASAGAARQSPVAGMTLAEFAASGRVLTIRSSVLGCDVIFAADNAVVHNPRDLVVYRAAELALLWGYSPDELRFAHEAKVVFGAPLLSDE